MQFLFVGKLNKTIIIRDQGSYFIQLESSGLPCGILPSQLGLKRYGQQPYRYVIDTGLPDTIRIRYDKNVHDFRFPNQEF